MTSAEIQAKGIEISFADGRRGLVPYSEIPGVDSDVKIADVELPNPYLIVLCTKSGETVSLSWDFVRHYSDADYRPGVAATTLAGRKALGARIKRLRESVGSTQQGLARAAGIGRVTLVRIEKGEQSPRFDTLASLARALERPIEELVHSGQIGQEIAGIPVEVPGPGGPDFEPIQIRGESLSNTVLQDRR